MATTTVITAGQFIVPGYPFGTATALVGSLTSMPGGKTKVTVGGMTLLSDVLQGGTGVNFENPATFGGIAPDNTSNGGPTVIAGLWPVTTVEPVQQTPIMNYCVINTGTGLEIYKIVTVLSDTEFVIQGTVAAPATTVLFLADKAYGATSVGITCTAGYLMGGLDQALVTMPAGSITVGYGDDRVDPFLVGSIVDPVNITLEAMVLGGVGGGGGGGAVNSVTASAPLASSGGANPNISIPAATALVNGYLKSTDWTIFNGKQNALTFGSISTATGGVTITNGANATVGPNTTINIATASGAATGLLSSGDWTTFNSKQSALTFGSITTSTGGVTIGSGNNSTVGPNVTVDIATASAGSTGLLTSADWSTFNGKLSAAIVSLNTLTGATQTFATGTTGTDFTISSAGTTHTFNLPTASAVNTGKLSSADWSTFNSKEPALTKGNLTEATSSVLTISGGTGAVIGAGTTIQVAQASGASAGYLSSADWTTFNSKQSALTFSTGLTNAAGTVTANLSTGVATGQILRGGINNGENLTITSTAAGTKGKILFGTSAYDEVNNRLGIGTQNPSEALHADLAFGIGSGVLFTRAGVTSTNASFSIQNATSLAGQFLPAFVGISNYLSGGVTQGLYFTSIITNGNAGDVALNFDGRTKVPGALTQGWIASFDNYQTSYMRIAHNGNMVLQNGGAFTNAGFRLDVNGTARVQGQLTGTGNLSITNGVGGNEILNFSTTSAIMRFGTQNNFVRLAGGLTTRGLAISSDIAGVVNTTVLAISSNSASTNPTSGTSSITTFDVNFNPTSGTAQLHTLGVGPTINQTGGANGITRGLYINPTLTAAADWRSIETSNNTGYAAYFAGSADLFFNDATDLQFGTTTGTKIGTGTTQKLGFWNAAPIAQPTTGIGSAATANTGTGDVVAATTTFDGYTIPQIVKALRDAGLLA